MNRSKPLARRGKKAKREAAQWAACREAVIARSGGLCELIGCPDCPPVPHRADAVHHLCIADRDRGRHDPDRCLHACNSGHASIHAHPAWSYERGYLIRDGIAS